MKTREQKEIDALREESGGGGGSGVGRADSNHNEWFNYYDGETGTCTINGGSGNRAGGYNNTLNGCTFSNVYGWNITATQCLCCWVGGDTVTISAAQYSLIFGNSLSNIGAKYSLIVGQHITAPDCYYCWIGGEYHTISGGSNTHSSIIYGNSIIVTRAWASAIFGYDHAISTAYQALVSGRGASVTNSTRMAIGGGTKQSPRNIFHIDSSGNVTAESYNTNGADYAEMFEWADGNRDNEDRRGMLVALYGDMILPAHGDDFFGVVSAAPSVIGNNPQHWHKRYKKDVFGAEIRDEKGERIESDEYDPDREYIPRSERPEWSPVGMVGRLIITDDGSCMVGGYVSARQGIGTKCYAKTAAKVLKRIDEKHVEVLLKAGW